MWPRGVVVFHPCRNDCSCVIETEEQCLVQRFIAHLAIEALDITILHGLSWRDVMPVDLVILAPGEDGIGGEFSSIVTDNHARLSPAFNDGGEFARNSLA